MGCWQRLALLLSATLLAATGRGHTSLLIQGIQFYKTKKVSKEQLLMALEITSDIDEQDEHDMSALMWAARIAADKEVIEAILHAKADVNIQNKQGLTALMLAARCNNLREVVQAILHAKADVHLHNNDGWTALMIAAQYSGP